MSKYDSEQKKKYDQKMEKYQSDLKALQSKMDVIAKKQKEINDKRKQFLADALVRQFPDLLNKFDDENFDPDEFFKNCVSIKEPEIEKSVEAENAENSENEVSDPEEPVRTESVQRPAYQQQYQTQRNYQQASSYNG